MSNDERRFDPKKMQFLIGPERMAQWDPPNFLARLGIQPGQSVLDLGSGPGFWSLPLAEIVGAEGVVWALDASPEMLEFFAQRQPPAQVRLRHVELPQTELPGDSQDCVWAAFVFHEVTPPEQLASEMVRVLKTTGKLAILDWRPDAVGNAGPPRSHRLSVQQVTKYLLQAGFKSVSQTWQDQDHYLLEARRERLESSMKIAFVSDDHTTISAHFGRAQYYEVFTITTGQVTARETLTKSNPQLVNPGQPAALAGEHQHQHDHHAMLAPIADCQVLVTRGMGFGAHLSLKEHGIEPIITDNPEITSALAAYLAGSLVNHTERLH